MVSGLWFEKPYIGHRTSKFVHRDSLFVVHFFDPLYTIHCSLLFSLCLCASVPLPLAFPRLQPSASRRFANFYGETPHDLRLFRVEYIIYCPNLSA